MVAEVLAPAPQGALQVKLAASSILPEPLYLATCGYGHNGRVRTVFPLRTRAAGIQSGADRWEKAMSDKTHRHGDRESHSGMVPTKRSNEGRGGPKEIVEERPLTKENAEEPNPA